MSLKDRLSSQPKTVIDKGFTKTKLKEGSDKAEIILPKIEGLGILEAFLVDENLNSIYVSSAKNIYVEKRGIVHKSASTFRDNVQLINLIKKNASEAGIEVDENVPYIKFNYKEGINISATLPPISNVPVMFIKNYNDNNASLKSLQENKTISKEVALVIETLATTKLNILIAGNPQSLKTTILSTIAKLSPINSRTVLIDCKNEIKTRTNAYVSYDFMNLKDEALRLDVLKSIFSSNPDRIAINDCDEKIFYEMINNCLYGFKGITTTINANSTEDAINDVAQIILKNSPNMNYEAAKQSVYKIFDIVIVCSKEENGFRTISKLSELKYENKSINDIFYLNNDKIHSSTSYVPEFCRLSKTNSMTINTGIFDENYKHTYYQGTSGNYQPCNDLIKKMQENASKETFENSSYNNDSDNMLKKAQEKFEELKRNARNFETPKEITNNEDSQNLEHGEYNLNG